jgi:hypothetical protein
LADYYEEAAEGVNLKTLVTNGGTAYDISWATTKYVLILRPDGTSVTGSASFTTDGTDGYLDYLTSSTDLQAGWHTRQPQLTASGKDMKGEPERFWVAPSMT